MKTDVFSGRFFVSASFALAQLLPGNISVFIGKFETMVIIFIYRKLKPQQERPVAAQKQAAAAIKAINSSHCIENIAKLMNSSGEIDLKFFVEGRLLIEISSPHWFFRVSCFKLVNLLQFVFKRKFNMGEREWEMKTMMTLKTSFDVNMVIKISVLKSNKDEIIYYGSINSTFRNSQDNVNLK